MIHFDERDKQAYGSWRPIEHDGEPHHCPGPSTQQEVNIPSTSQYYNPQQQHQQQQQLPPPGTPRPVVIQLEKGTWDRLREQIISIHRTLSEMAIDIDEIKQDIALIRSANSQPTTKRDEERTSDEIFGRTDDREF
jgi:hypothetical protein